MRRTMVVSVFAGCGKTWLTNHQNQYGYSMRDSDSSTYEKTAGWEKEYINSFMEEAKSGKYDFIFVCQTESVIDEMDMSGIENGDFADIDETTLHIFSSMTVKKEQVSVFTNFLTTIREIAVECDATLDVTAEFVPLDFEEFAAMIMDFENGKAVPKYFRY